MKRRLNRPIWWLLGVVLIIAAGFIVVSCTGNGSSTPGTGGGRTPSTAPGSDDAAAVTSKYLPGTELAATGTVAGTVRSGAKPVPAQLDVLAVIATDSSTVLRWRLSTPQAGVFVDPGSLSSVRSAPDTSGVTLYDPGSDLRLEAGHWTADKAEIELGAQCSCSKQPNELGPAGVESSGLYQALPEGISSIQVRVPGFAPVTVPVSRP